jgi:hypothetical protein
MTAALPGSSVTEGARSLEVRWIYPGQLDAVVAGWFGRFPAGVDSREDSYLLDPDLRGLSVKVRAGGVLEVKVYGGSPGILDVPGRARGRWWSLGFEATGPASLLRGGLEATAELVFAQALPAWNSALITPGPTRNG